MKPIQAILFDADGVLQRPRTRWRAAFAVLPGLAEPATLDRFARDVLELEATFLEREDDFSEALAGMIAAAPYDVRLGAVLSVLHAIEVDADVLDVIRSVRAAGSACYLATNQQSNRATYMSGTLGYAGVFDGEFYSCRMGVAKPKREFFERVVAMLDVPADLLLFIDDRPENVGAAMEVGMRAEVFDGTAGCAALVRRLEKHGIYLRPSYRD